jgi:hypothetical protein
LRLGDAEHRCFTVLIYPASGEWLPRSDTHLLLHDGEGKVIAEEGIAIACSGSALVFPHRVFSETMLNKAGPRGYVLIRDTTCRLFGYHGLMDGTGRFSLDHMFGF